MRKIAFLILLTLLLSLCLTSAVGARSGEYYWYCKRNGEHRQPSIDSNFDFVEESGGVYVDRAHSDECEDRVIYLTFDVGYENGNVARILDALRDEGAVGSFFILGNVIKREGELVLRMLDEGHIVCNHTVNHKNLVGASAELFESEVLGLEREYEALTGRKISKFFRPPEGTFDKELILRARDAGYRTVFWSFAYADWDNAAQMSEDAAMEKILANIHNGEIMLLHPTSATNAKIMKRLLQKLKEMGYRFATLEEME